MIFEYKGEVYPNYLKVGNACQFIAPAALKFCQGEGLDVGAGKWPLPGAIPVDVKDGGDAMELPHGRFDYIFSSHCLEHLANPIAALEHWKTRIKPVRRAVCASCKDPDNCRAAESCFITADHDTADWRKRNISLPVSEPGGVLFLYLPHPDMTYWKTQHCRKHLHSWTPEAMAEIVSDLGFVNVIHSGRDLEWSFAVVGFQP